MIPKYSSGSSDTDTGATPLYMAAQIGHLPVVERLVVRVGAGVDKATTDDAVAMLLKSGADKSIYTMTECGE